MSGVDRPQMLLARALQAVLSVEFIAALFNQRWPDRQLPGALAAVVLAHVYVARRAGRI